MESHGILKWEEKLLIAFLKETKSKYFFLRLCLCLIKNFRVTAIAARLKITHGVVSKIVRHYRKTGSILPRERKTRQAATKPLNFGVDSILNRPPSSDSKKYRNLFAKEQVEVLEKYFKTSPYPKSHMKKEITEKTLLSEKEITVRLYS